MLTTKRSPLIWVYLIIFAGILQYLPTTIEILKSGEVQLWQVSNEGLSQSGYFKYIRDITLIVFGMAWIFYPSSNDAIKKYGLAYATWIGGLVLFGIIPYLFDASPFEFFYSGLRWIVLLHASAGFYLIAKTMSIRPTQQIDTLCHSLLAISAINIAVILFQLQQTNALYGLTLGASRLTGIFSNAGASGFFGLFCFFWALCTKAPKNRLLIAASFFTCLASGTRFLIIIIVIELFTYIAIQLFSRKKHFALIVFSAFSLLSSAFLYFSLIEIVGRGGIIEEAMGSGGRIYNIERVIAMLTDGNIFEAFFGRGLGLGTNTAATALPLYQNIRFNELIDNAFLTSIFQIGIVGTIFFMVGGIALLFQTGTEEKTGNNIYIAIFAIRVLNILIIFFAGSPFDHYYLMLALASSFGLIDLYIKKCTSSK